MVASLPFESTTWTRVPTPSAPGAGELEGAAAVMSPARHCFGSHLQVTPRIPCRKAVSWSRSSAAQGWLTRSNRTGASALIILTSSSDFMICERVNSEVDSWQGSSKIAALIVCALTEAAKVSPKDAHQTAQMSCQQHAMLPEGWVMEGEVRGAPSWAVKVCARGGGARQHSDVSAWTLHLCRGAACLSGLGLLSCAYGRPLQPAGSP